MQRNGQLTIIRYSGELLGSLKSSAVFSHVLGVLGWVVFFSVYIDVWCWENLTTTPADFSRSFLFIQRDYLSTKQPSN